MTTTETKSSPYQLRPAASDSRRNSLHSSPGTGTGATPLMGRSPRRGGTELHYPVANATPRRRRASATHRQNIENAQRLVPRNKAFAQSGGTMNLKRVGRGVVGGFFWEDKYHQLLHHSPFILFVWYCLVGSCISYVYFPYVCDALC
jgi:hypothetical protein